VIHPGIAQGKRVGARIADSGPEGPVQIHRRDLLVRGGYLAALASAQANSLPGSRDREVLNLASRAPSGHNTQPWTVRIVNPDHWVAGIDAARRLPAVDAAGRETLLSLGAFLENLVTAFAHYGYAVEYDVIAKSPTDAEVIDLRLRKTASSPQDLNQILLRRTVRSGQLAGEVRSADLTAILGRDAGDFRYFPKGTPAGKYLSNCTLEANRQQAYREPAQQELANWIRWSAADGAKYRNGLTPAAMEIEGLSGWYVRHFYDRSNVISKAFREATIKQVSERVREGGGWLVLSGGGSISELIETGRKVERLWLRVREWKIAIHPMTQVLEESPWREQISKSLGLNGTPQFVLRIGYVSAYPEPSSLRMPPSWVTK
jgi:hypothetical protein